MNQRVQVFDAHGEFLLEWGSWGAGGGQFLTPVGIAIGSSEHIYVTDALNDRVQVFSADGEFLYQWGTKGSGNGQFDIPIGIAVGPFGMVYVADHFNNRVQVFSADGIFLTAWGTQGSGDGEFSAPFMIAVDDSGDVYVTESDLGDLSPGGNAFAVNHRVQVFDATGRFLRKWGSIGGENDQFACPYGIAIGPSGWVYVADHANARVSVFK